MPSYQTFDRKFRSNFVNKDSRNLADLAFVTSRLHRLCQIPSLHAAFLLLEVSAAFDSQAIHIHAEKADQKIRASQV